MALFPKCTFEVRLPDGVVRAGERLEGTLVADVPEDIPHAEKLDLFFRTHAIAQCGEGKNSFIVTHDLLVLPVHLDLPETPLRAGHYTWPFALDIPAWLPPNFTHGETSIRSTIDVRLDVDWAVDPKVSVAPRIVQPPTTAHAVPVLVRSPPSFHEKLVIEVTLNSSVVAHDQAITGQIAVRGGHDARYEALELSLASFVKVSTPRGATSQRMESMGGGGPVRIAKERLVGGEEIAFRVEAANARAPTFRNGVFDHDVFLQVCARIPWTFSESFEVPLTVLPPGSRVADEAVPIAAVGATRLRQLAALMSAQSGLPAGVLPTLVEGTVGPVSVRVTDDPRNGRLGVNVDFTYPDLALGIVFRPLGMLDGFRESPLLPPALGTAHFLRANPPEGTPAPSEEALGTCVQAILAGTARAAEIGFSDHQLRLHLVLPNDGADSLTELARFARKRAEEIAAAITALPFPPTLAASAPAWHATAAEEKAFLVPHVPAIHGVAFGARVTDGETRTMRATVRALWRDGTPGVVVDLDLRETPLAASTLADIVNGTGLAPVRALFSTIHATSPDHVALEAAWAADPRALLPALERFFDAVLDARGERRAEVPYR